MMTMIVMLLLGLYHFLMFWIDGLTGHGYTGWNRWLPGFRTLREYQIAWLRHDILAGLGMTTMQLPVASANAVATGVPGIYGLYATIVPLIAYALFGPSRILVLGPDSSLAAVILAVVLPLSGFRMIDDYKREHNYVAFTGGCVAVLGGFPVWAVLHAGGFVPPPHAFGIYAIAFVSMMVSFLYARWRL